MPLSQSRLYGFLAPVIVVTVMYFPKKKGGLFTPTQDRHTRQHGNTVAAPCNRWCGRWWCVGGTGDEWWWLLWWVVVVVVAVVVVVVGCRGGGGQAACGCVLWCSGVYPCDDKYLLVSYVFSICNFWRPVVSRFLLNKYIKEEKVEEMRASVIPLTIKTAEGKMLYSVVFVCIYRYMCGFKVSVLKIIYTTHHGHVLSF